MPAPLSLPKGYQRLGNFPLDDTSIFATKAELATYASSNPTAYAGQICSAEGLVYTILADKSLAQAGLSTIYSDTQPANPANGQRWVDTTDYRAYERVNGAWIEIPNA